MKTAGRVQAALIVVQLGFGAFPVAGKLVLGPVSPVALATLRVLVATPLLFLLAHRLEGVRPRRADLRTLALLGLLGVAANQLLFIVGLHWTTASNAAVLMPTIPVFTVALAAATGIERLTGRRLAAIGLAIAGALVVLDPLRADAPGRSLPGDALVLANCLSYGAYLVLLRPVLGRLPPLTVTAWAFLFGGLVVLPIGGPSLVATPFAALGSREWGALAFIVLWPTLLNYALNTWAVRRSSPSLAATYVTAQPVITALLALPLLGEGPGWRTLFGFLGISAGLLLVARTPRAA